MTEQATGTSPAAYRVAIVGMGSESSGFAPHRTTADDFTVWRGDAVVVERHPYLDPGSHAFADLPQVTFVGGLVARALPGGPVTAETYEGFAEEIVSFLRGSGPFDGVLLDLHGATLVEGRDDAEGDLAHRVKDVVGGDCLVAASMDLHGQVSREFASLVDLPTCYRTAPHVDWMETRERATRLLAESLVAGTRLVRAWVPVPVALPGEKTSTRDEPARSIYASLADDQRPEGVLETALWAGYPWADEPRAGAAVVSVGTDRAAVVAEAERVAGAWWSARDDFSFCAPTGDLAWALREVLASEERPFFVSDSGDNPTAGGSGDVVSALRHLLSDPALAASGRRVVWSAVVDPQGVELARSVGVDGAYDAQVGGCFGWPDRVRLVGRVVALTEDEAGTAAVVECGPVRAVLTSRRRPFHAMDDYRAVGLDPTGFDVVVNKIGYLEPDLHAHARGWVLALTDGPVDQRIERLEFRRLRGPIHPFADVPADAPLEATVFES